MMRHMTVSELETVERCPMEYHLKYRLQVPSDPFNPSPALAPNIVGDITHRSIQMMLRFPQMDVEQCVKDQSANFNPDKKEFHIMVEMCVAALATQFPKIEVEVPFVMRIGDVALRGTIDLVGKDEAGWHIVDYKTDQVPSRADIHERAAHYRLQMQAYAIALHRAGYTPIIDVTLHFLRLNEKVTWKVSSEWLNDAHLLKLAQTIQLGQTPPNPPCANCPFHHNRSCPEDRLHSA